MDLSKLNLEKLPKTPEGYPYAVFHQRPTVLIQKPKQGTRSAKWDHYTDEIPTPKGGKTTVLLFNPNLTGEVVAEGVAVCHPVKDGFNKRLGREIALGRARKFMRANPALISIEK